MLFKGTGLAGECPLSYLMIIAKNWQQMPRKCAFVTGGVQQNGVMSLKHRGQCLPLGRDEGCKCFRSFAVNRSSSAGHTVLAKLLRHRALWLCSSTDTGIP